MPLHENEQLDVRHTVALVFTESAAMPMPSLCMCIILEMLLPMIAAEIAAGFA